MSDPTELTLAYLIAELEKQAGPEFALRDGECQRVRTTDLLNAIAWLKTIPAPILTGGK